LNNQARSWVPFPGGGGLQVKGMGMFVGQLEINCKGDQSGPGCSERPYLTPLRRLCIDILMQPSNARASEFNCATDFEGLLSSKHYGGV